MSQSLLGFARAPRETIEGLGVEAFLAEACEERAKAGAREARVDVGRIVDKWNLSRLSEGDEVALFQADERPGDQHAVARRCCVHAAQTRDARAAQQSEQHRLRLIVGMMRGEQRSAPIAFAWSTSRR